MPSQSNQDKKEVRTSKSKVTSSTQDFLNIAEIRDNTVVLKNGTLRSVLMVSSVNFALKAEEEQNAIIQGYISFLNSLSFPLQVVVQSRQLNIDTYLEDLKKREQAQTNELLRRQTASYREYIKELISLGQIMSKHFYVTIPYEPAQDSKKSFLSRLGAIFAPAQVIRLKESKFRQYQEELDRRVDQVYSSLQSLGLASTKLDTQSLIELYYNTYNPYISQNEKLVDIQNLKIEN